MTCSFFMGALVVLLFPIIVLLWATESKQQRAKRWRKSGQTYASIASRLSISPTTARRYCLA
jgi:DNA-binding CsgD family transcriptional regulator